LSVDPRTAVGLMVVAVVIVAMAVTGASLQQEPTYEASAQVWVDAVSPANGKIQPIPLAPSPQTLQALTLTMIHTIDSRPVAEEAIQRLERVMNLGESRIEMRISRSAWFPRDLCFPHP
jgi:uncharacterized protein involved in exopolysaccharide biosynthesis